MLWCSPNRCRLFWLQLGSLVPGCSALQNGYPTGAVVQLALEWGQEPAVARVLECLQSCSAVTENTRASYPINHIDNARIPCLGPHPKNLILLCCDAFGVLPPISRLSKEQAMYHFISGYTAKVGSANKVT